MASSQLNPYISKPDGFNPYAAGAKLYGPTGRLNATQGHVSLDGMKGYKQRDNEVQARKQAVLQRMQAAQAGNYLSPAYLKGNGPT
jgi:hypothetical protein